MNPALQIWGSSAPLAQMKQRFQICSTTTTGASRHDFFYKRHQPLLLPRISSICQNGLWENEKWGVVGSDWGRGRENPLEEVAAPLEWGAAVSPPTSPRPLSLPHTCRTTTCSTNHLSPQVPPGHAGDTAHARTHFHRQAPSTVTLSLGG